MSSATVATTKKSWANIVGQSENVMETVAVIEVHEEIVVPQTKKHNDYPVTEKKNYSTDVDPLAMDIARNFYECYQDQIVGFTRRNDLQHFFHQEFPNAECEFPVVLYALAKGLRLVNCFNRGQDLEWRQPMKKHYNTKDTKKKNVSADGWVTIGKTNNVTVQAKPIEEPIVEPSPRFSKKVDVPENQGPVEELPKLNDDEIIAQIGQLKTEIKVLENEIESLIPFHREHLREMKRFDSTTNSLSKRMYAFHDNAAKNLEDMLDELQNEINIKTKTKNQLCDMLKQ